MKIKIDVEIECSPEELKASWNLPDLAPMQEEFVEALACQIRAPSAAWPIEAWIKFWRAKEGAAGPTDGTAPSTWCAKPPR
jgi:hypothetical protein